MKSSKFSTPWLVAGGVIAAHVVIGASLLMIQGCGTTRPVTPPPEPKMPEVAQPKPATPPAPVLNEPAPPQLPVSGPEAKAWPAETTEYTVAKGDSISLICKRTHVDKAELMALNNLKDPNKIRVGQKLMLPGKVSVSAPKPAAKAKSSAKAAATKSSSAHAEAGGTGTYVVKAGDSLSAIAKRHKTTSSAIRQANNLKGDKIVVGRKLVIPGAVAAAAPAAAPAPAPAAAPAVPEAPAAPAAPVAPEAVAPAPAVPDAAPPSEFDEMKKAPAPAAAAPAPSAGAREHKVVQGEDLYTVAMTYGVSVNELKAANGLTDTAVTPGTTLKIPAAQ